MKTLKLDIDLDFAMKDLILDRTLYLLRWLGLEYNEIIVKHSSNNHIHIYIELKNEVSYGQGITYQLLLGDDPHRYKFNELRQGAKHAEDFNILFDKKRKKF